MSELRDFVLEFCRLAGGISEPASYGVYEVLFPQDVAERLGMASYQCLTFEEKDDLGTDVDATHLSYGHPLVETMIEQTIAAPANVMLHINNVRLEKRGLDDLARTSLALSNARLNRIPRQIEKRTLHHYVRFTFQAALISDEKHERLVSVLMDAQNGYAAPELADLEQKVVLASENVFKHLSSAPPRWLNSESDPLSRAALAGLMDRAVLVARDTLNAPIEHLARRANRFLELDQARLTQYYDDMESDLIRRRDRASDQERSALMQDKLEAVQVERRTKLADVEAKYRLRVELRLLNLMVVTVPKLTLKVEIKQRHTQVIRTVVWNPLLHQIEPLFCDVCGQPATRLTLCSGGHLVHTDGDCLLADEQQCVDCKRLFCRQCAGQVQVCVVCKRPVCQHSLNRCAECGRGVCSEHVGLCHAADGEPLVVDQSQRPEMDVEHKEAESTVARRSTVETDKHKEATTAITKRQSVQKKRSKSTSGRASRTFGPKAAKIDIYLESDMPAVSAYVLTSGGKVIAHRIWELLDKGIVVGCRCEKTWLCPVDQTLLEPAPPDEIDYQLWRQVGALRQEYGVSPRKVNIYTVIRNTPRPTSRLVLHGAWKER